MKIENQIEDYHKVLVEMSLRVRSMMVKALDCLSSGNKEVALHVVEMDEFINHEDSDINDRAIEVLSLLQPVASDLRLILAGIRISNDLERIGDYAKNIAKYVIKNNVNDIMYSQDMVAIGNIFLRNYDEALLALKDMSVELAYKAPANDDELDEAFKVYGSNLEESITKNEAHLPLATFSILRNIERAGDHTKNVCESIIYAKKGQHIDFG